MKKSEFIKKFKSLSQEEKRQVKQYHETIYKNAIFSETLSTAEKCLLWIKEAE